MSLSKKHYIKLAQLISKHRVGQYNKQRDFIKELADYLQEDNELFDRDRFYSACGVGHLWN